jgi:hypothetical protein
VKLFPETLGHDLRMPPALDFGRTLDKRPAGEWKDLGKGVRAWQSGFEEK